MYIYMLFVIILISISFSPRYQDDRSEFPVKSRFPPRIQEALKGMPSITNDFYN